MGPRGTGCGAPIRSEHHRLIVLGSERQAPPDPVDHQQVAAFDGEFRPPVREHVLGLGGEPDDDLPGPPAGGQFAQDVRVLDQPQGLRAGAGLLDLLFASGLGPVVGDGRGHDHGVRFRRGGQHRRLQLAGRGHPLHLGARRVGEVHVRRHQGHLRAAGGRGPGERIALPPGRPVAEEADGIEFLPGAARADHDPAARQISRQPGDAPGEHPDRGLIELIGLGQAAGTGVGAGQPPGRGFENQAATLTQGAHVGPGGRVLPHLGVHRGREDHRAARHQQDRGEQVVGPAGGRTGQQVSRGGGGEDEIRLLAEPDMGHLVHAGEGARGDRLTGQSRPGGGAHEPQ